MKKKDLKLAVESIKKLKLNVFENKAISTALFKNFMALVGELRAFETKIDDMRTAFLNSYQKEQGEVAELQQKLAIEKNDAKKLEIVEKINGYKKYLDALKAFNDEVRAAEMEEIKTKIIPIDEDKFMEEYMKQDECDMSVVEGLLPLFKSNIKEQSIKK